jgi:type I restriction enzyme S subunit
MSAELRPGYKNTDVGVMPQDWDVKTITEICDFIVPGRNKPKSFDGDIPWITTPDLTTGQGIECSRLGLKISLLEAKDIGSKIVPAGSVLMSCVGELGIVALAECDLVINQQLHAFIPSKRISSKFLLQVLATRQQYLYGIATKTTLPYLNKENCNSIKIQLPSLDEQQSIALALSDIDALIRSLDQLIVKKRDIQQAAMQQLLTGQCRLPGFSGEWEVKRLGNHLSFLRNGTNSRAELSTEGDVHYLHYGDIHSSEHLLLNPTKTSMPCLPRYKAKRLDRLDNGDLVFADASEDLDGVGKSVELQLPEGVELVAGLHTIAVRFHKKVITDGFKAYLQFIPTFRSHLRQLAAGTKVYATSRAHIASAELQIPGIEEQAAIATILSDMDAELAALEARREKARQLKQGMMPELLTGRIRLT